MYIALSYSFAGTGFCWPNKQLAFSYTALVVRLTRLRITAGTPLACPASVYQQSKSESVPGYLLVYHTTFD